MAGRKCSVCCHPAVDKINEMLVNGASCNEILTIFNGLGDMSLYRHKQNHLPKTLSKAKEAREAAQGADLFSQVRGLRDKAVSILVAAERAGDLRTALVAIREARSCLELLGKISGELPPERLLLQIEPAVNQVVLVLRQEIRDPETLQRISRRLLLEAGNHSGKGTVIDV